MSRRPARFTQSDLARALRAVKKSGEQMAVEISADGTIRIVPDDGRHKPKVETGKEVVL